MVTFNSGEYAFDPVTGMLIGPAKSDTAVWEPGTPLPGLEAALSEAKTKLGAASAALTRNEYGPARLLYLEALARNPNLKEGFLGLVRALKAEKSEGLEKIAEVVGTQHDANALNALGVAAKNLKDLASATYFFEQATFRNATLVAPYYHLGTIAFQQRNYVRAKGMLTRTVELAPTHAYGHYSLALVCFELGESKLAKKHAAEATRLRGEFSDQDLTVARTHRDAGRVAQALASYRRAMLFNSNNAPALTALSDELNTLGVSYKDQKDYNVARQAFTLASFANPTSPHPSYHLGTLAMQDKRWEEAQRYFTQTLAHTKDHRYAHYQLGLVYQHLHSSELARRHLTRAQELGHPSAASALANLK